MSRYSGKEVFKAISKARLDETENVLDSLDDILNLALARANDDSYSGDALDLYIPLRQAVIDMEKYYKTQEERLKTRIKENRE